MEGSISNALPLFYLCPCGDLSSVAITGSLVPRPPCPAFVACSSLVPRLPRPAFVACSTVLHATKAGRRTASNKSWARRPGNEATLHVGQLVFPLLNLQLLSHNHVAQSRPIWGLHEPGASAQEVFQQQQTGTSFGGHATIAITKHFPY